MGEEIRIIYHPRMNEAATMARAERRARAHAETRAAILAAARTVATRDGAKSLSLRGVAAEAGFAPAALYGYFRNKDELLLALAADDLAHISRAMRTASGEHQTEGRLAATCGAALDLLCAIETIAAAPAALAGDVQGDVERLFNGRLIGALTALSTAMERSAESRDGQRDVLLVAAAISGLALLVRSGRLETLGFSADELLLRIEARFSVSS